MNVFSAKSMSKYASLCGELQDIADMALELVDFAIIDGHRGEVLQNYYELTGRSTIRYPNSKHNTNPSMAMDLFPAPYDWKNVESFYLLAAAIFAVAEYLDIEIAWGGHWEGLKDFPHYEIKE